MKLKPRCDTQQPIGTESPGISIEYTTSLQRHKQLLIVSVLSQWTVSSMSEQHGLVSERRDEILHYFVQIFMPNLKYRQRNNYNCGSTYNIINLSLNKCQLKSL